VNWYGTGTAGASTTTSFGGMSSTFRLIETFAEWREAIAFADRGRSNFAAKPVIRRAGERWVVRYEPRLILMNGAA
jgi:hypothetical protein